MMIDATPTSSAPITGGEVYQWDRTELRPELSTFDLIAADIVRLVPVFARQRFVALLQHELRNRELSDGERRRAAESLWLKVVRPRMATRLTGAARQDSTVGQLDSPRGQSAARMAPAPPKMPARAYSRRAAIGSLSRVA